MKFIATSIKLILFLTIISSTLSCKKDNVDPLKLYVTPDYLVMNAKGGANFNFTISGKGPTALRRFKMEVQENTSKTTLVDSTLEWGKTFSLIYKYAIPKRNEDYTLTFYFHLIDNDGNTTSASRVINVSSFNIPASEKTGEKIYTQQSGLSDAYDLLNFTALMSTIDPASTQDIVDVPDGTNPNNISHAWTSSANAKFVLYNAFDYANATKESIMSSFLSGTALGQISNIQAGSTILIETDRNSVKRYYAVQIISINEDNSGNNDFYLLNIKY